MSVRSLRITQHETLIYYWWGGGFQFWLFILYRKGEMKDLNTKERRALAHMLRNEIQARTS